MRRIHIEARGDKAVYEILKAYYTLRPPILLPDDIVRREFAFQPWGAQSYVRHLSFRSVEEVLDYMERRVPLHSYYSLARYELPEASSMEEKGFIGADLMFDIDADHFEGCNSKLIPDKCILEAAQAMERLARILKRDFNIKNVTIYYTGHRGFHLIASCDWCESLSRGERAEIARYVSAYDLKLDLIFPKGTQACIPEAGEPGWRGRIGEALSSRYPTHSSPKGECRLRRVLGKDWEYKVQEIVFNEAVPVDLQVTQDLSRLVRIPGSINGKTGLKVTIVENPLRFKPSTALAPIKGEATIRARETVNVDSFLGEHLNLEEGRKYRVNAALALVLARKEVVDVIEVIGDVQVDTGGRAV
jgi:DNA primase small subunit